MTHAKPPSESDPETDKRQQIYETQLQKKELEESLMKEKNKLNETEMRATNWRELTENVLHFSTMALEALKHGETKRKREVLNGLGWNHRLESKKLFIDLGSWFKVLKEGEQSLLPEIKALELEKIVDTQERIEAFASIRPRLCAG